MTRRSALGRALNALAASLLFGAVGCTTSFRSTERKALVEQPAPAPLAAPAAPAAAEGAQPAEAQAASSRTCPAEAGIERARGTVRYVCDCGPGAAQGCQPGHDSSDGLTVASPLRTYDKARQVFAESKPGDVIAFCQGGSFTVAGGDRWVAKGCRADNPCVIRDYAPPWGGRAKPLIRVGKEGRAFGFEDGGEADHDEGYMLIGLALKGSGSGTGVFVYNDADDIMLCDLLVDGFQLGVYVAGSNPPANTESDGKNSRITLRGSQIVNNTHQGWLGGCDGCAIEYNRFENNGFDHEIFLHNIYFGPGKDQRIVGNELYRNAIIGGRCRAVSLVMHGEAHGLLIENNLIREDVGAADGTCWGIAIDGGYKDTPEGFFDVTIRGNTVINVGNVGIGVSSCQNCLIENNVVIQEQPFGTTGIAAPDRSRGEGDVELANVTVRNNSLFFGSASGGIGILVGGEGRGHSVTGNSIQFAGTSSGWACFQLDLPVANYTAIDRNLCHAPGSSGEWVLGRGSLADWQKYSGTSAASSTADPRYRSVVHGQYVLAPADAKSPLVNAGDARLSSRSAIDGTIRDGSPDIGAYEWKP